MRKSLFERDESFSAAEVARSTRDHLDGLRRGVLFLTALGIAVFLFVGAGRRAAANASPPLTISSNLCAGYEIPCAPTN